MLIVVVIIKTIAAKTIGTAIFPVKFAPPGKNGTKPNKLFKKIKKKTVSKNVAQVCSFTWQANCFID